MINLSPVAYVLGILLTVFGCAMLIPAAMDVIVDQAEWQPFVLSSGITISLGMLCVLAFQSRRAKRLSLPQAVLLLLSTWTVAPAFGSLPFLFASDPLTITDAYFEAMSGLTTTGSTVMTSLETRDPGLLLWRGLLQWTGGIVIVVIAIAFLPRLAIGGMQLFRGAMSHGPGGTLFRLRSLFITTCAIYFGLTVLCGVIYALFGMDPFDAIVHAMTTIATGGFSTRDSSFSEYPAAVIYSAAVFMILASFPFLRYIQLVAGKILPLLRDSQIHAFLGIAAAASFGAGLWHLFIDVTGTANEIHHVVFNVISLLTGTGYANASYETWGGFAMAVFFLLGLVGGCAGSTTCSVKVFRYQILAATLLWQIRQIGSPHRVAPPRYQGEPVSEEIISSVMGFLFLFAVSLVVLTILLSMTGLDLTTASSGAATALANVGPGLGEIIGPGGNFASLPVVSKWLLIAGMLIGRLEILAVFVVFRASFWRA